MVAFPIAHDQWNYEDEETTKYAQRLWWNRIPRQVDFTLIGKPGNSQVAPIL